MAFNHLHAAKYSLHQDVGLYTNSDTLPASGSSHVVKIVAQVSQRGIHLCRIQRRKFQED